MKIVFHIILFILFSVIQPTWLEYLEVFGAKPNLFLVYVIICSCFCSKKEGAILGFFFGLVLDFIIGYSIGLNAVLMILISYTVVDFCCKVIGQNTVLISAGIVFVASFVYELTYYVVSNLGNLELGTIILRVLLPECLANVLATFIIYFIVKKIVHFFDNDKGEVIG